LPELTDESTSRFVQVKEGPVDTTLHVNDAGDGPAVIMIHGGGPGASGWSNFHRNIGPFVEAGFRVVLIDCPGFGQSDPLVTSEQLDTFYAQAVAGVMRELGIARTSLIGNSMGGATSIQFALDRPEQVDKLVLMGPAAMGRSVFTPMPMEGIKLLFKVYLEPSMESLNEMLQVFVHDPSRITDELRESRFKAMMRNDAEHLKNFVKSMQAQDPLTRVADLSVRLGEIKAKTLATHGVNDRFVPMDHALKLVGGIPDCRLVMFNNCGHWVQWEHADEFNRIVIDFIKN
jgi:pimeloyl-ACP methyl ester carboxylesterase